MNAKTRWLVVTSGLWGAVASCVGGEAPREHELALVVLDRDAREAGVSILGADTADSALPVAVSTARPITVAAGRVTRELMATDGDVVLVRGADATIERYVAGEDVDADRIVVDAPADLAAEIADALGAAATVREDGLVELEAPDVLWGAARAPAVDGVVETTLVLLDATPARQAPATLRPRAPWALPAPSAPAVAAATLPAQALVLRAPSEHEIAYRDLPPAVSCEDAVAGTWIARRHFPGEQDWYFFTMRVVRSHANRAKLTGEILAHSWNGGPNDVNTAQACEIGGQQWVVRMPASGRVQGGRVEFGGTSWSVAEHTCGWAPGPGEYNLDRFSGATAPDGEATWSNDDGGRMIDEPFEFRRVSCDTH